MKLSSIATWLISQDSVIIKMMAHLLIVIRS